MSFQRKVKRIAMDMFDRVDMCRARTFERKKFRDPRRRAIFGQVKLSVEQKREIDELFLSNYGTRVPYTWHRHFTAMSGSFDPRFMPELLYIPEFERFENLWPEYVHVYEDKNVLPLLAEHADVRMPQALLWSARGVLHDAAGSELSRKEATSLLGGLGECFAKPSVDSCSGRGCRLLRMERGSDVPSGEDAAAVLDSLGSDFVVQERLRCHETVSTLHPSSVNTFRIMTYRWRDAIEVAPPIMRIGRGGGYLDNAHAGGVFCAVDEAGKLGPFALTEFNDRFERHPDTGIVFGKYWVPGFAACIEAARRAHRQMLQIGVVNWDFTLDESGAPVLLEANLEAGGIWVFQMAHGCGPFGERTAEILRWMRLMKKLRASERPRYAFGQMPW